MDTDSKVARLVPVHLKSTSWSLIHGGPTYNLKVLAKVLVMLWLMGVYHKAKYKSLREAGKFLFSYDTIQGEASRLLLFVVFALSYIHRNLALTSYLPFCVNISKDLFK